MFRNIYTFFADLIEKRSIIIELTKRDFQQQYQGSYLSFIWIFLQPLCLIFVLYIIFTIGFRAGATVEGPYSLYLISGIVSWIYFSQNLTAGVSAVKNYSFLVKKMDFRLSILPIVKLLSSSVAHLFLVVVAVLISWYQGYSPSIYTLQVVYYYISMLVLLLGLNWMTSSAVLFVKDVSNIVAILVQFGLWLTPVFWNISMIPTKYQWLVKMNPIYYIVSGYRDSILSQVPFWERYVEMLYFWSICFIFLFTGVFVYRRLRPHFAEVI